MSHRLLQVAIRQEVDVVLARQRTRRLTAALGFDKQDQTRITTAVSEIARNAYEHGGGGRVGFFLIGKVAPQLLEITVTDSGPGIDNVEAVLNGSQRSLTGLGLGLIGARRLMDQFQLDSEPGRGTTVSLRKFLPSSVKVIEAAQLPKLMESLAASEALDPFSEIRRQNQELLLSLEEVRKKNEELEHLNLELEDTNRGVVALYAELDERADHLRRADEIKSRFLSDMSHEFRTPLNSIMALSRLLLDRIDGSLSPDQDKQIRLIRRSAETLTELVNDLLDLAKVEAGKIDIRPVEFSLDSLFGALRGMLRPLLAGDRVNLVFDDVAELPTIFSDESKVSQILRNFISNALKFTERGEVRVSAALDGDERVVLSVRDTGAGIAAEHLEAIFQEFVQLDNPAQRRHKGTGLGLPLAKKLAQLLNGSVAVDSVPGQGSTFTLYLPLLYVAPVPAIQPVGEQFAAPSSGIQILAVEDDPADLHIVEKMFSHSAYALTAARTTAEARRLMQRTLPAAVLLDLVLAGEDTWRFLAALKQDPATRAIPVIVTSSLEDEQKALAVGADAYVHKPLSRSKLLPLLARLLRAQRRIRVLVIEDEEAFRYVIRQLLPASVYEVLEAITGTEGIRIAKEVNADVILLDINLPEIGGAEIIERLLADERTRSTPIVVLTAATQQAQQAISREKVYDIVRKEDLSRELLISYIAGALNAGTREVA